MGALSTAALIKHDPEAETYGVTPLEFGPTPHSIARPWFADDLVEAHLNALERERKADGGWPISWEPPSEASRAGRPGGNRSLFAMRVLTARTRAQGGAERH